MEMLEREPGKSLLALRSSGRDCNVNMLWPLLYSLSCGHKTNKMCSRKKDMQVLSAILESNLAEKWKHCRIRWNC